MPTAESAPSAPTESVAMPDSIVWIPGSRLVTRLVVLDGSDDIPAQIELALEGFAPFPPEQLYHGHLLSPDKSRALVYAIPRRLVEADELAKWERAACVWPDFLPLLAHTGDPCVLLEQSGALSALAWRTENQLPDVLVSRAASAADKTALLDEVAARAGLHKIHSPRIVDTAHAAEENSSGEWKLGFADHAPLTLTRDAASAADLREKTALGELQARRKRETWLWRACLLAAVLIVASLLGEAALGFFKWRLNARQKLAAAQAEQVIQLDTAQALAQRIEALSNERLKPLEMLAILNGIRPDDIRFQRVVAKGRNGIEIEAETNHASTIADYQAALRQLPALDTVEIGQIQSRSGKTRFQLTATFKLEALK